MSYSRTRTRGGYAPSVRKYVYTKDIVAGGETFVGTDYCGDQTVMNDRVVPGFKTKSAQGEIIINPMDSLQQAYGVSGTSTSTYTGPIVSGNYRTVTHNSAPWERGYTGSGLPSIEAKVLQFPSIAQLETEAITKAYAAMNDFDMLSLVSMVEAEKTLKLVPELFMGTLQVLADYQKYLRALKGGKLKQARKAWGKTYHDAASLWLALRYGLTPFLFELEGLTKALRRKAPPERKTFRAQVEYTTSSSTNRTSLQCFPWFSCNVTDVYNLKQVIRVAVVADFQPIQPGGNSLPEQLGFSWRAVPISIWEALPLSFVADWIVNIGDFVSALSPNPNWAVRGASLSSRQLASVSRSLVSVNQLHTAWYTTASGSETCSAEKRLRRPTSHSEIGTAVHVNMNLKRILDSVALTTGRIKSTAART